MTKKTTPLAILLCIGFAVTAQDYDFGKVSKEELLEKFNPQDSSAAATYLYKNRRTFYRYDQEEGFQLVTEVHERIKIYSKDGFDYATKEVNLHKNGSDEEKINGIKAFTYNLVGGKIEETKLKNEGIFDVELSRYYDQTKFTMPNIKEGSVLEYKYRIQSPFVSLVDEFRFQHDIPVKKVVAEFEVPEYFNFRVNTKGFLNVVPKNESRRDKITFNTKHREGFYVSKTTYTSTSIDFTKTISTYDLTNVPALKDEPYVNNIDNYRSAVKYELSYTKFPNGMLKYYSTTWEDVVKTIYESPDFGTELNKEGYYEEDLEAILSTVSDPQKRIAMIFNFVKSRVKWNGYYGKYTHDGVRKAYKEQVGNAAEINLMLTSMLRHAGVSANPVLVSTRKNGVPLFPTREGYNYVICGVEIPNGVVLLDATSKYSMPNVLPFRTLNWEGRVIRKDGSSALINLYPNNKAQELVSMNADIKENGDVEGMIRNIKKGHDAMLYREKYNDADKDDFIEKMENKYGGMEISDFEVANENDLSKPVSESYKFMKDSQVEIIGDRLYLSPLLFLRTKENPFTLEKREFPVDFAYPSGSKYRINIKIPDGYAVETVPEPITLMLPDNLGGFKYIISQNSNMLQVMVSTDIDQPIISSVYYDTLKDYYKQMIEKMNERVVLSKI